MSRRNQKPQHKPAPTPPRSSSPGEAGLKAFRASNYIEAIRLWNAADPEAHPTLRPAVAEAYFRRALAAHAQAADAIADLRQAVDRMPEEARYWYHLALMLHRADRVEESRSAYARAADLGLTRQGSGFARGLAELEINPACSLETLAWLSPESRATLEPIAALLRNEPQAAVAFFATTPAPAASGSGDPAAALWQGLALLASGDAAGAMTALAPPKGRRLPMGAEATRALYYGVASALSGEPQAALTGWREMTASAQRSPASVRPEVGAHISQISAQSVATLLNAQQWEEALRQAQSALTLVPDDLWLLQATLIADNRLAESAREKQDWEGAAARWQAMRDTLKTYSDLGSLAPILHNLAVAYEALEDWEAAGEAWAALLGTMTRRGKRSAKKAEDNAANVVLEQQRAWLRRRLLDNYKRAERPDEAITYYKQAVKADPDNLELRLELAEALSSNEQTVAARNEIQRILDRDPKHIGAFLLQAHIHEERGEDYAAEQSMRRVLEIDPQHDTARRGIGHLLAERGMSAYNHAQYAQARTFYTEALTYAPDDIEIRVFMGETELALGHTKAGQDHFETALATGKPLAYIQVFSHWARWQNEPEARKLLAQAEAAGVATPMLLMDLGVVCLTRIQPSNPFLPPRASKKAPLPSAWETWGRALIQQGLEASSDPAESLQHLISAFGPTHSNLAIEYARKCVALQPDNAELYLSLALLQALNADTAGAKTTLTQAERAARKQNRPDLLDEIAALRTEINSPMFGMLGSLLASGDFDMFDE